MISAKVKVSPKYQIVIPKRVRRMLRLERGEEVVVTLLNDLSLRVSPSKMVKPTSMRGVGKELWQSLGGAEAYLTKLHQEWESKT